MSFFGFWFSVDLVFLFFGVFYCVCRRLKVGINNFSLVSFITCFCSSAQVNFPIRGERGGVVSKGEVWGLRRNFKNRMGGRCSIVGAGTKSVRCDIWNIGNPTFNELLFAAKKLFIYLSPDPWTSHPACFNMFQHRPVPVDVIISHQLNLPTGFSFRLVRDIRQRWIDIFIGVQSCGWIWHRSAGEEVPSPSRISNNSLPCSQIELQYRLWIQVGQRIVAHVDVVSF